MSIEERRKEIWDEFEQRPALQYAMARDCAPWHNNIEDDYH